MVKKTRIDEMTLYNSSRVRLENLGVETRPHSPGKTIVDCLGGEFSLVVRDDDESVGQNIIRTGYWESWITSWFTQWVRPGMTVLDAGANCGYYTMLSERLVGRHGSVVAYEPSPEYLQDLADTRKINHATFKHRPVALGAESGSAILSSQEHHPGGASIKGTQGGPQFEVRVTTLDAEERNLTFFNPDIIKMDVESAEEDMWLGGQVCLNGPQHTTLLLEWTPGSYSDQFAYDLAEWGDLYVVGYAGEEIKVSPGALQSIDELRMIVVRRK